MITDLASLFSKKNPPLVGLDISSSGVRLVELSETGKNDYRLERCASEALPRGAVVDGNIENIEQVSEAVRRVFKKSGTRSRQVALGLPPAAVITKKIVLFGGGGEDELEVQVETEASQYIPFALEEVSLDFDVIGPAQSSPDDVEVLLAATRKEKVEDRVAAVEAAGLKPMVMDVDSYAARAAVARVASQLKNGGAGQIIALFQMGSQVTHVSILLDGQTIYEREQPFGGDQLTQDIARAYGLPFEDAEARKIAGGLPEGYEQDLLRPFRESAALEVTRAIQFFFTSTPYTHIDHIFLAGGCANIRGLQEIVTERSKVTTAVVSPFMGMAFGPEVNENPVRDDAPAFLVACGLAMRRVD